MSADDFFRTGGPVPERAHDVREDAPARMLEELVAALRTSSTMEGWHGAASHLGVDETEVAQLGQLFFFCYCSGIFSTRRIVSQLETDSALQLLASRERTSYASARRFREAARLPMQRLFAESLAAMAECGMTTFLHTPLDAMLQAADATARLKAAKDLAGKLLDIAAARDAKEDERFGADRRGDELPRALVNREARTARFYEMLARRTQDGPSSEWDEPTMLIELASYDEVTGPVTSVAAAAPESAPAPPSRPARAAPAPGAAPSGFFGVDAADETTTTMPRPRNPADDAPTTEMGLPSGRGFADGPAPRETGLPQGFGFGGPASPRPGAAGDSAGESRLPGPGLPGPGLPGPGLPGAGLPGAGVDGRLPGQGPAAAPAPTVHPGLRPTSMQNGRGAKGLPPNAPDQPVEVPLSARGIRAKAGDSVAAASRGAAPGAPPIPTDNGSAHSRAPDAAAADALPAPLPPAKKPGFFARLFQFLGGKR